MRTIVNLTSQLGDEIEFKIITGDRDALMENPYAGIEVETWLKIQKVQVYYVDKNKLSFVRWRKLLNNEEYDVLYLNSLFSFWFSIKPIILARLGLLRTPQILMAPRGELGGGALGTKARKKKMFLAFARYAKLYQRVVFQASSRYEQADIIRVFGDQVRIVVAPDIPALVSDAEKPKLRKKDNFARFIYLGRIEPVKNLKGALLTLLRCKQYCELRIFGPIRDNTYWEECKKLIVQMPKGINVKYIGEVDNSKIDEIFLSADYLFLPSLGENFGHVIYESLARGTPVLISDQTPWKNLQAMNVGWDIPLGATESWESAVSTCVSMSARNYESMSRACLDYARTFAHDSCLLKESFDLFDSFRSPLDMA